MRFRLVYFLFFLFALVLVSRLFFVQVVKRDIYTNSANKQYIATASENFHRGSIYFTTKDDQLISAATIKNGFQATINPKILADAETTYEKLSKIITLDRNDFLKKAGKKNDPYEIIARRLDSETAEKIKNLDIKGLSVFSESWRYYPAGELASRVLGFVGYKGDSLTGRYGLEQYYNAIVSRDEEGGFVNFFAETLAEIKKIVSGGTERGDIVLTIEPSVQSNLEKNLKKTAEKFSAEMAGGIIIEPQTGKILAMAALPSFNPNSYSENTNLSVFMNPMVENVFEMGSVMKPLTLAAAIDQGKITAETTYYDKGYVDIDNERIENFDGKAKGTASMQDVLNSSLNTGAVFAMQKLGRENFLKYLLAFGLDKKTGIDLPEEVPGMLSNLIKSPREIEYATASFGQGIAVTPIAMVSALSSLANGGFLMKPYVVREIKIDGAKDKKTEPEAKTQVIKKETAEEMSRMLSRVFDEALLGGTYKMERYSVAVKTGTAQMIKEGQKGYTEGEYIHAFSATRPPLTQSF